MKLTILLLLFTIFSQIRSADYQECSDNLGKLVDRYGYARMSNRCTPFVVENDQRFKFEVSFLSPYVFDDDCLDIEVIFENNALENGSNLIDEWKFHPGT